MKDHLRRFRARSGLCRRRDDAVTVRIAVIVALGLVVAVSGGIGWMAWDLMQHDASVIGRVLAWGSIAVAAAAIWGGIHSARRAIGRKEVQ